MALRDLGQARVDLTMVCPEAEFTYKPLTVEEPFSLFAAERRALAPIAEEFGAKLVQQALESVRVDAHSVELSNGEAIDYDVLVLCIGAKPRAPYAGAVTFTATEPLRIDDFLKGGEGRIVFVVAPGVTWSLPIYELALMTRRRSEAMGVRAMECVVVTPESAPLVMFGSHASAAVSELLQARRIELRTGAYAHELEGGDLVLTPGNERLEARTVIALPILDGPRIAGLPADDKGFIPIDEHARVVGANDVYAAGDGTTFPIKQGGIATQQADAAAEHIAARAGANIDPAPFRPVLRGQLLTGDDSLNLKADPTGGAGEGIASADYLWWPPHKVSGRYLAAWFAGTTPHQDPEPPRDPLDVQVSISEHWHREPMLFDPYGPSSSKTGEGPTGSGRA